MKYCLNITITPDTVVEANETLEVVLRTTDDYVTLLPSTATVSILDDDSTSCDLHGTCFGIDLGFLVLLLAMQALYVYFGYQFGRVRRTVYLCRLNTPSCTYMPHNVELSFSSMLRP